MYGLPAQVINRYEKEWARKGGKKNEAAMALIEGFITAAIKSLLTGGMPTDLVDLIRRVVKEQKVEQKVEAAASDDRYVVVCEHSYSDDEGNYSTGRYVPEHFIDSGFSTRDKIGERRRVIESWNRYGKTWIAKLQFMDEGSE